MGAVGGPGGGGLERIAAEVVAKVMAEAEKKTSEETPEATEERSDGAPPVRRDSRGATEAAVRARLAQLAGGGGGDAGGSAGGTALSKEALFDAASDLARVEQPWGKPGDALKGLAEDLAREDVGVLVKELAGPRLQGAGGEGQRMPLRPDSRGVAAWLLGQAVEKGLVEKGDLGKALRGLGEALGDEDPFVRLQAARTLGKVAEKFGPLAIESALKDALAKSPGPLPALDASGDRVAAARVMATLATREVDVTAGPRPGPRDPIAKLLMGPLPFQRGERGVPPEMLEWDQRLRGLEPTPDRLRSVLDLGGEPRIRGGRASIPGPGVNLDALERVLPALTGARDDPVVAGDLRAIASRLEGGASKTLEPVTQRFQELLKERVLGALEKKQTSSPFYRLGRLLQASAEYAKNPAGIDKEKLNEALKKQYASMGKELDELRGAAFGDLKLDRGALARQQVEYLQSQAFRVRRDALDPRDRAAALKGELDVLKELDPRAYERVRGGLLAEEGLNKRLEILRDAVRKDPKGTTTLIADALEKTGALAEGAAETTGTAQALADALGAATGPDGFGGKLPDAVKARIEKTLKTKLSPADFERVSSRLDAVVGFATLAKMGASGLPKDPEAVFTLLQDVSTLGAAAPGLLKVFGASTSLLEKASWVKSLGPVAGAMGFAVDIIGADADLSKGDIVGGSAKLVSAGAGFIGTMASIAVISGATGPGAPITASVCTAIALGAWGVDLIAGESDEATFRRLLLKELQIQKQPPP